MATNFSINARRIRDLQEVTTIGEQFVPAASYVLVDAADANNMYTSYKMKVSALSDAISGMVGADTIQSIRTELDTISSKIMISATNAVVSAITSQEGFIEHICDSISSSISGDIRTDIYDALIENNISGAVLDDLRSSGIADDIADSLKNDDDVRTAVIDNVVSALSDDSTFVTNVANELNVQQIANIISTSLEFKETIINSLSDDLIASPDFITAVKAAIDALEP